MDGAVLPRGDAQHHPHHFRLFGMAGCPGAGPALQKEVAGAMKGRLIDLSLGLNRKQRITIEVDRDFREDFDRLKAVSYTHLDVYKRQGISLFEEDVRNLEIEN